MARFKCQPSLTPSLLLIILVANFNEAFLFGKNKEQEEVPGDVDKPTPVKFFAAYQMAGPSPTYVLEGQKFTLPCVTDGSMKPSILDPKYKWFGQDDKEVKDVRIKATEVGDLEVEKLKPEESGLFKCNISPRKKSQENVTYNHTLIVYSVPKYERVLLMIFLSKDCDQLRFKRFQEDANKYFCVGAATCQYKMEYFDCIPALAHAGQKEVKFKMAVKPPDKYVYPSCNVSCIKKAVNVVLMNNTEAKIAAFKRNTKDVQRETSGMLYLDKKTLDFIDMPCPIGTEIFKDLVCVPCDLGYARSKLQKECTACGYFAYQDRVGRPSCTKCPWFKMVLGKGAITKDKYFYQFWFVMIFFVPFCIMFCFGSCWLCTLCFAFNAPLRIKVLTFFYDMCCDTGEDTARRTEDGKAEAKKLLFKQPPSKGKKKGNRKEAAKDALKKKKKDDDDDGNKDDDDDDDAKSKKKKSKKKKKKKANDPNAALMATYGAMPPYDPMMAYNYDPNMVYNYA